ncbi:MAG TPA: GAF domain-containing protein, partial [bacterium]|nr:GAF domain-containing protein [bacterium]
MKVSVPFKISSETVIVEVFENSLFKLQRKNTKIYFSSRLCNDLKVAFMEAVTNAIKHAAELTHQRNVQGKFLLDDKIVGFEIYDHGQGFHLDRVPVPDLNDLKASGRGIFMMKQLGECVSYQVHKKRNALVFKRNLIGHHASTRELDLLYELSEAIISNAGREEVYQIILSQALELFHVERASILIFDETDKRLKVAASRGISDQVREHTSIRPGEGVSGYVFQHGRSLLIEDINLNTRGLERKKHYKTSSFISAPMICSPLRLDEKPIGVINLTDRVDGKKFTKKDLKLLSTIANQAMACLHIRNLIEETKEKERLKQEMDHVRRIQSSYLPVQAPAIDGWDLAGRCDMAQSVGGDYFDFHFVSPHLYLIIADVAGHNTSSAVTMVNFRSQLKAYLSVMSQPQDILARLNQSLYHDLTQAEQFVSTLLIQINVQTGDYVLANAGH